MGQPNMCPHCNIPITYIHERQEDKDTGEVWEHIVPYCDKCGAEWG